MSSAIQTGIRLPDAQTIALIDLVWGRLQARLERGLSRVERLTSSLFDRSLDATEVTEAIDLCEALASKMGTLGLGASAELVRKAANAFEQPDLDTSSAIVLASLMDDARSALASTVAELKQLSTTGQPLAIVGEVSELVDELVWVAATQGLPVSHHVDGVESTSHEAAAVVVVIDDPDLGRSRPLLRGIRETHPSQPILLIAPEHALVDRARVVDTVSLVLHPRSKPLDVINEVRREIARSRHPRTVSLFGRNADTLTEPLWRRGLGARTEDSLESLMERLRSGESRAVILMADGYDLKSVELVRLIRTDRQTRGTVVILLGHRTDGARAHAALREGADAFFGPEMELDDLVVTLKARLTRRSELEPVADGSVHTGTVAWTTALVLIERMLLVSFRQNVPVGIGVIEVPVDENFAGLDEAIAREFRGEDVITRLDDRRLVVALQGVSRRVLMRRLNDIHQNFFLHERGIRSIGLEFPVDGRSLDELFETSAAALVRAEEESAPLVIGADWQPWRAEAPDVLLVDPDATLGSVLSATLSRRGLKVTQELDALDALDRLTGRTPSPLPRVVLMELDQRGIDGQQFLRQLREAGTAGRFRIIILSGRTQESDMRRAFELGADDFVTKPFSTPLLLHRLGRALEN